MNEAITWEKEDFVKDVLCVYGTPRLWIYKNVLGKFVVLKNNNVIKSYASERAAKRFAINWAYQSFGLVD